jgi:hypothetical protein
METQCVSCEVRNEFLKKLYLYEVQASRDEKGRHLMKNVWEARCFHLLLMNITDE